MDKKETVKLLNLILTTCEEMRRDNKELFKLLKASVKPDRKSRKPKNDVLTIGKIQAVVRANMNVVNTYKFCDIKISRAGMGKVRILMNTSKGIVTAIIAGHSDKEVITMSIETFLLLDKNAKEIVIENGNINDFPYYDTESTFFETEFYGEFVGEISLSYDEFNYLKHGADTKALKEAYQCFNVMGNRVYTTDAKQLRWIDCDGDNTGNEKTICYIPKFGSCKPKKIEIAFSDTHSKTFFYNSSICIIQKLSNDIQPNFESIVKGSMEGETIISFDYNTIRNNAIWKSFVKNGNVEGNAVVMEVLSDCIKFTDNNTGKLSVKIDGCFDVDMKIAFNAKKFDAIVKKGQCEITYTDCHKPLVIENDNEFMAILMPIFIGKEV